MSAADILKLVYNLPENQQWQIVMKVLQKLQQQSLAEPGEPMSLETFKKRIAKADQDILEGKTFSTEEVRNRVKKWK